MRRKKKRLSNVFEFREGDSLGSVAFWLSLFLQVTSKNVFREFFCTWWSYQERSFVLLLLLLPREDLSLDKIHLCGAWKVALINPNPDSNKR